MAKTIRALARFPGGTTKIAAVGAGILLSAARLFAGFASQESFLPAVGRGSGNGIDFFTTVWATNLTSAPVSFTFEFLKQGQGNPSPASFTDSLAPGQTKVYENVIGDKLGIASGLGAARVTSTGEILLAERIYNQAPGDDVGNTEGLFFAGVPKTFSISLGQSASIQGINQGGSEDFRYNFALVETGGAATTVNVQLFDGNGVLLGQKAYALSAYEQLQPNVTELASSVGTTNARITATVTSGTGSVLIAGAQVANGSHDSSGFEMSFRDSLLGGGGGTAGVTSLNGLTGAVTLAAGSNVTLNKNGNTLTINAAGGGGGGGLTLPFSGSVASGGSAFSIQNTGGGQAISGSGTEAAITGYIDSTGGIILVGAAVQGFAQTHIGVLGSSFGGPGVNGQSTNGPGVRGDRKSVV